MNDKPLPKYRAVKQEILSWIHSGRCKLNEMMLSENELAEHFQVSRQTVRQTFSELEQEGWLIRIQGKGTFVSSPQQNKKNDLRTVGVITTYISDYIFPHIVRGIEATLRSLGYRLVLCSTDNDPVKEKEALQMLMSQPLDGLIIEPTKSALENPNRCFFNLLQSQQIPYLMINAKYPELDCPILAMEDVAGGFLATEHLFQLGHRRIAGFFKTDDQQGEQRMKGFTDAHAHYQLPLEREWVVSYTTENKWEHPSQRLGQFLQNNPRPSAIVCYNDELAIHLMEVVRQVGLHIPDEVSIIGYDDAPLATATPIKLTTIVHPKFEMGQDAADLIVRMIENRKQPGDEYGKIFKPVLTVRDSTKMN